MIKLLANESPLKQKFDKMDIECIDWFSDDYKKNALKENIKKSTKLVFRDWDWRASHKQNVVASFYGWQGQGKTKPCLSAAVGCGKIFKRPFDPNESLFYSIEELNEKMKDLQPRTTILKDEQRHGMQGYGSRMQNMVLADFEEQLREPKQINLFFTSVFQEEHAHFFVFEAKNIDWNADGTQPDGYFSVLLTPRYTNPTEFVWRGLVYFPHPDPEIEKIYVEKKAEHIKNLENQFSSTFNPIYDIAKKIFEKYKGKLSRKSKDGFVLPLQSVYLWEFINTEIGTSRFSIKQYSVLLAELRKIIEEYFASENHLRELEIIKEKDKREIEQKDLAETIKKEKEIIRTERNLLLKEKLEEMRKQRELKQKLFDLKLKELENKVDSKADEARKKLVENQEKAMEARQ